MKPGSVVRVIVPDGEIYAANYLSKSAMPYENEDARCGLYTPMMSINRIMRSHGHQFIYDYDTMAALLAKAQFSKIQRLSFMQGADSRLLIDTPSRQIESLYVEAVAMG